VTADGLVGSATNTALRNAVAGIQRGLGVTADGAWGSNTEGAFASARTANYVQH
jgi:hypothetical protein